MSTRSCQNGCFFLSHRDTQVRTSVSAKSVITLVDLRQTAKPPTNACACAVVIRTRA